MTIGLVSESLNSDFSPYLVIVLSLQLAKFSYIGLLFLLYSVPPTKDSTIGRLGIYICGSVPLQI